ncbi:hypothetical protein, partial [Rickettsiella grylli]|uniref:hypothetical protein n=1 Tax=Rickettsiella grylli TaxID=59196 RepID=UPI000AC4391F
YEKIKNAISSGLSANNKFLLKKRLKQALKTSVSLVPIVNQCEINQLLPVKVDKNLADVLRLPSIWVDKAIDSNIFFDYLDLRRKA